MARHPSVLVLFVLLLTCLAACSESPTFLNRPNCITFDRQGNLVVSDYHHQRVVVFDREGRYLDEFGGQGLEKGRLWQVWDLQVLPDGGIMLVNHRIAAADDMSIFKEVKSFDSAYNEVAAYPIRTDPDGEFGWPASVALDPDGNTLVVDQEMGAVLTFDPSGVYLGSFEGPVGGPPLDNPSDVRIRDGQMWVVEEYAHRIRRFTLDGVQLAALGEEGRGPGQFLFPQGIDFCDDRWFIVADLGNHRVQRFSLDCQYLDEIVPEPVSKELPVQVIDAKVGPDCLIYIVDSKGGRVIVSDVEGNVVRQISRWD